mmetsp:Transcript_26199/g.43868  ORF Transcript_26199/g.43868 Transcript_26199/m.43868 type:complete len:484 (+) Transcript_26199:119-1570(+)
MEPSSGAPPPRAVVRHGSPTITIPDGLGNLCVLHSDGSAPPTISRFSYQEEEGGGGEGCGGFSKQISRTVFRELTGFSFIEGKASLSSFSDGQYSIFACLFDAQRNTCAIAEHFYYSSNLSSLARDKEKNEADSDAGGGGGEILTIFGLPSYSLGSSTPLSVSSSYSSCSSSSSSRAKEWPKCFITDGPAIWIITAPRIIEEAATAAADDGVSSSLSMSQMNSSNWKKRRRDGELNTRSNSNNDNRLVVVSQRVYCGRVCPETQEFCVTYLDLKGSTGSTTTATLITKPLHACFCPDEQGGEGGGMSMLIACARRRRRGGVRADYDDCPTTEILHLICGLNQAAKITLLARGVEGGGVGAIPEHYFPSITCAWIPPFSLNIGNGEPSLPLPPPTHFLACCDDGRILEFRDGKISRVIPKRTSGLKGSPVALTVWGYQSIHPLLVVTTTTTTIGEQGREEKNSTIAASDGDGDGSCDGGGGGGG